MKRCSKITPALTTHPSQKENSYWGSLNLEILEGGFLGGKEVVLENIE